MFVNKADNTLDLQIFSTGTTPIYDTGYLKRGEGLYFQTGFPGGLYLAAGIFIPKDPSRWWAVKGTLRAVLRNGLDIVYEGYIDGLQNKIAESAMGVQVTFMGAYGWYLMQRDWRKRWADDRTTDPAWIYEIDATLALATDKCTVGRDSRLRFLPKAEAWGAGDTAYCLCTSTPGETIKRVVFDYDLTGVAGEDWTAQLYDMTGSASIWSVNQAGAGSSSGSVDVKAPGDFTASSQLAMLLIATGAATPTSDGATFLNITNLVVYTEDESAGSEINLSTIAADMVAAYSAVFNADTQHIDTAGTVRELKPFITSGDSYEPLASILDRAAMFGDGDNNSWATGCYHSEKAATPTGKPVLFCEQYPDVTAWDVQISKESPNLVGGLNVSWNYAEIYNNARVEYRDSTGRQMFVTSADAAALADATSIAAYGQRDILLRVGNSTSQNAIDYGTRFISKYKDPRPEVDSFTILNYMEGVGGQIIGAPRVVSKMRVKVDGFGDPITKIIARTEYDFDSDTLRVETGEMPDMAFEESIFAIEWNDAVPTGEGSGGGEVSMQSWWKIADLIGERGVADLKRKGLWGQWKKDNYHYYEELMKRRGK